MPQFTILLLIAIVCVICLFLWNGLNYRTLKKLSQQKDKELNDAKYWELKYKQEFMIAIVALLSATAGFLGYNSLQSVETSVKTEFNKKVDSVKNTFQQSYKDVKIKLITANDSAKTLNEKVRISQKQLERNATLLSILTRQQLELKVTGFQSKNALHELSQEIDSINVKNKIKREFYLITNIPIKGLLDPTTIKFSQLKTNTGDRLPLFKKPPIVIAAWGKQIEYRVSSVSSQEIQIQVLDYSGVNMEQSAKITYFASFIIYPTD